MIQVAAHYIPPHTLIYTTISMPYGFDMKINFTRMYTKYEKFRHTHGIDIMLPGIPKFKKALHYKTWNQ